MSLYRFHGRITVEREESLSHLLETVEESCERFVVIDQEVVWYGNINLLAKTKVDDSIMRVLSNEIAGE